MMRTTVSVSYKFLSTTRCGPCSFSPPSGGTSKLVGLDWIRVLQPPTAAAIATTIHALCHRRLLMTDVVRDAPRLGLGFASRPDESPDQLVGAHLGGLAQARLEQRAVVRVEALLERLGMGIDRVRIVAALRVVTGRGGQRLVVDLIEHHPGTVRRKQ